MDAIHFLIQGFNTTLTVDNLLACFMGVMIGTFIGVLPGLGPTATMAILLPLTFPMGPTSAIIMLAGIYYGAQYGGSTTSILVNIPGEIGSIVTCLDGYPLVRHRRHLAAQARIRPIYRLPFRIASASSSRSPSLVPSRSRRARASR